MSFIDYLFIGLYFSGVMGIGWWSSRKSLNDSRNYFLGGGSIGWAAIGASLFASNISAEHFIGLAGSGASSGLAVGQFEWLACLALLLLGWIFVPVYLRTGVFTMPEFLERRYNPACRAYLSGVSLIAYIFTKISVSVYAGALVLETILGWNIWAGAVFLIMATGIYTIFGGLRAVIYTDFFQAFILIAGAIIITLVSIDRLGGLDQLIKAYPPDFFSVWRPFTDRDFPWTGILFGAPILGIWYWCTDQMIVQRVLAAPDISKARRATLLAGYLKILPVFILVLPGLAGAALFKDVPPNAVYAAMVGNLLPAGLKGLVVAALLSALMSSLSSVFNSSSTLVVMDFYKKWRPGAGEKELVRAGQASTVVLVLVGLAWLPFIGLISDQLYVYLQSVQAYIAPPIAAVFLVGLFSKRVSGTGALITLVLGFILGAIRFVVELAVKAGHLKSGFFISLAGINFLHFAIILFIISILVLLTTSAFSKGPTKENLEVIYRPGEGKSPIATGTSRLDIAVSLALAASVLILWAIFSPLVFH